MIRQCESRRSSRLKVVSNPAGLPKHYRIQFQDLETGDWHMYAKFRFLGEAEACLDSLLQRGIAARLVTTDRCPVGT